MKNKILLVSIVGAALLLFVRSDFVIDYIFENFRGSFLTQNLEFIHNVLLVFPITLFFSLVTYKAPEKVFAAWWRFTRVSLPIVLFITVIINLKLHHSSGGWINVDADIDRAAMSLTYALFVIGSAIQIIRGYRSK